MAANKECKCIVVGEEDDGKSADIMVPTSFQAGSEWVGVCTFPETNDHYPFELEVLKVNGPKVKV